MHSGTSRYDPDTPMYDMRKRDGKRGYQLGEATYRGSKFGPRRSVQDVRGFPGLHHLQLRQPWPGAFSSVLVIISYVLVM